MPHVPIAQLKAHLSRYLQAVRSGQDVIVTDRGIPVARLCPIGPGPQPEARTRALIRAGVARPPRQVLPADFWDRPRPADPQTRALTALLEDRTEGR